MKTLKKTLCLVLAMVMVFGLCVTSASAHLGYSDTDDITYKEAVDVMSGIGVLAGDSRGFRPTADITRAEAAKIIAYIMIGDAERADALKATSDPFVDVPTSHWAAGYISYCATAGIIAGMGDGYHPNDNVTGLAFAKMLLCALGYGVNGEYVGTDWAINVSRDALRLGVFHKNVAGANNNKATREECALYAFNVLHGANDDYTGIYKVSYSALLGGYITTGAVNADSPDANMGATFAQDYLLVYEPNEEDPFGRDTGHHWVLATPQRPVISAEYEANKYLKANANGNDYWATFTTEVTGGDIYKVLGADVNKDTTTLELYVNGTRTGGGYDTNYREWKWNGTTDPGDKTNSNIGDTRYGYYEYAYEALRGDASSSDDEILLVNFKKNNDKTLLGTGKGVQTFVYGRYINGTLRVKICIVDTYLAQVTRVAAASGNKDAETTVRLVQKHDLDRKRTNGVTYDIPAYVYTFETDEFAKDEYVLVTIADEDNAKNNKNATEPGNLEKDDLGKVRGEVVTMVPAVVKSSEVTKFSKRGNDVSIVADGDTYVAAKDSAGNNDAKDSAGAEKHIDDAEVDDAATITNVIVNGKEHTLYIDEFGYLIATSELVTNTDYVYVAQFGIKIDTTPGLTDKFGLVADVYYSDGTHEIVSVNTKKGIFNEKATDGDRSLSTATISQIESVYGKEFARAAYAKDNNTIGSGTDCVFEIGLYSLEKDGSKVILRKAVTDKDEYTKYICMAVVDEGHTEAEDHDTADETLATNTGYKQYVTKGQARIDANQGQNRADSKTVFYYVNGEYGKDDYKVVVYNGISNVPSVKREYNTDALLSEYAVSAKANNIGAKAVQAAVVDAKFGETGTIVYFYGGSYDEANYDKLKEDNVVSYKVFGGDKVERLDISYKTPSEADEAIKKLDTPGFVKIKNGELVYVVDSTDGKDSKAFDKFTDEHPSAATAGVYPFYYSKKDGDGWYVNYAEIANIAGIHDDTLTAKVRVEKDKKTDDYDYLYMPLYDLLDSTDSIVDLRTDDELRVGGGLITDIKDLLAVYADIERNHDTKEGNAGEAYTENDVAGVKIDGLRVAISYAYGTKTTDERNVVKTIYILDNVDCTNTTTPGAPVHVYDRNKGGVNVNATNPKLTPVAPPAEEG